MKPKRNVGEAPARTAIATTAVNTTISSGRKPWKKKTPVELIVAQVNKLRDDVTQKEEELAQSKKQLQQLDEVLKAIESP